MTSNFTELDELLRDFNARLDTIPPPSVAGSAIWRAPPANTHGRTGDEVKRSNLSPPRHRVNHSARPELPWGCVAAPGPDRLLTT